MPEWKHGGIVTVATPGTPVQFTTTEYRARSIKFQALPINTTRVVVGTDDTVRAGDGTTNPSGTVIAILGKPSSVNDTPPSGGVRAPESGSRGFSPTKLWLDAQTADEGVTWDYIED